MSFPREDYRVLEPYAPDRRPVAVDLSDNTNRWGPHPAALAVFRNASPESLTRYPSVYADTLKSAVAERWDVPGECVATGCGSDDLLDSTFRAVSAGGGAVAYMDPTFSMIPIFSRMNGLESVAVPWSEAEEDPDRLVATGAAAVYVCAPNNPTGLVPRSGWLEGLLDAVGPEGPVVVLDEAYAEFADESRITTAPDTRRLLVLRTLSKAFGLAGLRIGYAVGPADVVAEVEKSRGPYKVGRIDEEAAVQALRASGEWIDGIVRQTRDNRTRLIGELDDRQLRPLPSQGNFVFLPVAPRTTAEVTKGLRDRGVAVRPFPDVPELGDGVRVTIGPWEMMERFLNALDEVIS
ncbi:MAG: pyridoxal phosphate-dependent aminotransferase [Longimicrobiales bacterium]